MLERLIKKIKMRLAERKKGETRVVSIEFTKNLNPKVSIFSKTLSLSLK